MQRHYTLTGRNQKITHRVTGKEQEPTLEAPWSVESMHIRGRHSHPGEVRWRRLEAERGIECWLHILVCCHRVIFIKDVLVKARLCEMDGPVRRWDREDARGHVVRYRCASRGDWALSSSLQGSFHYHVIHSMKRESVFEVMVLSLTKH